MCSKWHRGSKSEVLKTFLCEDLRDTCQCRFLRKIFVQTNNPLCVHNKGTQSFARRVIHSMWFHRTFPPLHRILPHQIAFLFAASTFQAKFHQRMPHKRLLGMLWMHPLPCLGKIPIGQGLHSPAKWIPGPRCSLFMFTRQLNAGLRLFPCHWQTDKCMPRSQISCNSLWGHSGSNFLCSVQSNWIDAFGACNSC